MSSLKPRPAEEMWREWEEKIEDRFPQAYPMPTETLARLLDPHKIQANPVVLLDCRGVEEYAISRVHPKATQVDEDISVERLQALVKQKSDGDPNVTVVIYCSVGFRSARIVQAWLDHEKNDILKVYSLKGGIFAWANEKRLLVCNNAQGAIVPAKRVYAHNANFAKMLDETLRYYPGKTSGQGAAAAVSRKHGQCVLS